MKEFDIIVEKDENVYIGYCPEVPEANGQGETIEECKQNLKEAIKLVLQYKKEKGLVGVPNEAIREQVVIN